MKKGIMSILTMWILINVSLLSLIILSPDIEVQVSATTIIVDDDGTPGVDCNYTTIQEGIDAANPGDTVFVKNGTYFENVVVNKTINLTGEDRDTTIIDSGGWKIVVLIAADWVNVSGFTVTNSGGFWDDMGMKLSNVQNCRIVNNNASNNRRGIFLSSSSSNTIINNTASSNFIGGIDLVTSISNTIVNNEMVDNGIYIEGDMVEHWNTHIIDTTNTVNGKPVYYWKNQTGGTVPLGAGQVILANSTNVVVENQNVSDGSVGIEFGFSSRNTITNNTASSNIWGISLYSSIGNTIASNTASSNGIDGIYLYYSDGNTIANNTASSNGYRGIYLLASSSNTIANNNASNNNYGILIRDLSDRNTITNNTASNNSGGIVLDDSSSNNITNNNASNNSGGIFLGSYSNSNNITNNTASNNNYGIYIRDLSDSNTITNNTVTSNDDDGIHLYWANSNTIANNTASSNSNVGIYLHSSSSNTIINNTASNNTWGIILSESSSNIIVNNEMTDDGIVIWGHLLEHWNTHMIDTTNIVNGKPVHYWKNQTGGTVPLGAGQVILANSTNVVVENQEVNNATVGILLGFSSSNTIANNTASSNNNVGIYLHSSSSNTITNNTITSNDDDGIHLYWANSNTIANNTVSSNNNYGIYLEGLLNKVYHNNIIGNTNQALDVKNNGNQWDNGYPSGGNYWSDYTGNDDFSGPGQNISGGDGIGDLPYNSSTGQGIQGGSNEDNYPLMVLYDVHNPVANAGLDQTVDEDTLVTFNGSGSTDNAGITNYTWMVDDGSLQTLYGVAPTYMFNMPGVYNIILNVTNALGNWSIDWVEITVRDVTDPVANAGPTQTVNEDTLVTFNGSGSNDNTGITNYTWAFNDTTGDITLYGDSPSHIFPQPGIYTVTLNVTDAAGNWNTGSTTLTVNDVTNPAAEGGLDQIVDEDTLVNFNGSGSSDNVGITNYTWTFNDTTSNITLYGDSPSYTFPQPGELTVTLNVTDTAGNWNTDTLMITVNDTTKPASNAGFNQEMNEDIEINFDGSDSTDNVGIMNYTWTFNDGGEQILHGVGPTYTFTMPGIYNVTLNVTDGAGNWGLDWIEIMVSDVTSPIANAGLDQNVNEDTLIMFDGSGSIDNVGVTNYTWTFNDDGEQILYGVGPTYTFNMPGVYNVTLNVTDSVGNWDIHRVEITVSDITDPVANAGSDQNVTEDMIVTFDGLGSIDNVGIMNYTWTFNTGGQQTLYSVGPTYTLSTPGVYYVTLKVTDDAGNWDIDWVEIIVETDTDGDGIPDSTDLDDDNDGYLDNEDDLPLNASEWLDTDDDGIGNNADTDDDADGYDDSEDAYPLDETEWQDFDGDGVGDNADLDDDDDGHPDSEDVYPYDPDLWKEKEEPQSSNILPILALVVAVIVILLLIYMFVLRKKGGESEEIEKEETPGTEDQIPEEEEVSFEEMSPSDEAKEEESEEEDVSFEEFKEDQESEKQEHEEEVTFKVDP